MHIYTYIYNYIHTQITTVHIMKKSFTWKNPKLNFDTGKIFQ